MLAASRRAGVSFEHAWRTGLEKVRWPHDTTHRHEWRRLLPEQRALWEAAYNREPLPKLDSFARLPPDALSHDRSGAATPPGWGRLVA